MTEDPSLPICPICQKHPLDLGERVCGECKSTTPTYLDDLVDEGALSAMNDSKVCSICKRRIPLDASNFYRDKYSADGFVSMCKPCHDKRTLERKKKRKGNKPEQIASPPKNKPLSVTPTTENSQESETLPTTIFVDLSSHPDVYQYFSDLADDQERTITAQIRWTLRQLYKQRVVATGVGG